MPMMDWNSEGQGGGGFTVYPVGTYKVQIQGWEFFTKEGMEDKIKWSAKIRTPENYEGANISVFTGLRAKSERDGGTMWQTARLVSGCGVKASGKMDIESHEFKKVLDACKYRTTLWLLEVYTNTKGKTSNTISEYMIDPDQEEIGLDGEEDLPDFLKDKQSREPGEDDGDATIKKAEEIFKGKAVKKPRK